MSTLRRRFEFGTKAETLRRVGEYDSSLFIPVFEFFSVSDWAAGKSAWLLRLREKFGGQLVAVRSSAADEDGAHSSMAGAYTSVLNVPADDPETVSAAVEEVLASYGATAGSGDQILVQTMVTGIDAAGVITTHCIDDGAPYYVINYDSLSGRTDTVTGGIGAHKAVVIHRESGEVQVHSPRVRAMLWLARRIESITGPVPMDIEFALRTDGTPCLFQVRRLSTAKAWDISVSARVRESLEGVETFILGRLGPRQGLLGDRSILGNMPDWNPAEMIGAVPKTLAFSLYRRLITERVWREARAKMGYRNPVAEELMVGLAGRPYIDVRSSLNSFLPADLDEAVGSRLVNSEIELLNDKPEWHDRIEFEIAPTILDFSTNRFLVEAYGSELSATDRHHIVERLRALTARTLTRGAHGTIDWASERIHDLATYQSTRILGKNSGGEIADLHGILALLEECRKIGTFSFSILARHCFVAEALLRSAVDRGALRAERVTEFKRSIRTIAGDLTHSMSEVAAGRADQAAFLARFGHVRPGTYDITSPRYDDRPALFSDCVETEFHEYPPFTPTLSEAAALQSLLTEARLPIDSNAFFDYATKEIAQREFAKFVFSRNISDALERLTVWGTTHSLTRDDLSHLDIDWLENIVAGTAAALDRGALRERLARNRDKWERDLPVRISYIVRSVDDLYVVPVHRALPSFVTRGQITGVGRVVEATETAGDLRGVVVCIENADPGFDWIFSRGIAGLVTKFGGTNSHMAIRCAEFGLPAAIGCGELLYEEICAAHRIELDCVNQILRPAV
ncbi:PEP/pyruvate-binding domain-containing protein [Thalassobaculum sp. OXR-137]|uniref:PEP/pyruvate-binding domain-containing protein n=1 Tax=Thalassobaculum sp. OXR-137 TaxID=3100173 RepID=UPI002AC97A28|nr:PEP/pyruvate-binding domain-containing protein [Thalassobaculum sp. OXR-137]WPZ36190.1 PEP/pyruvate-binding domain-containing protein [Thalassobaculum sp. OXR-137]